jgi:protein-disulfide isomerase
MNNLKQNLSTILTIVFAAVLISASLIFFALFSNMSDDELDKRIAAGIEKYVQEQTNGSTEPTYIENASIDDDPVLGDEKAPVTMIVFSDFQCPGCAYFDQNYLPQVKKDFIDTGLIKFVPRDLPLDMHADAIPAAIAAGCAREQGGDTKYFEFHSAIFAKHTPDQAVNLSADVLNSIAKDLSLNMTEFTSCLSNVDIRNEVLDDAADATEYGIQATPSFILNGKYQRGIPQTYEAFKQILDQAVADAK